MTGPEHYLEAERLNAQAARVVGDATDNTAAECYRHAAQLTAAAQVHATLAHTAATVDGLRLVDDAWQKVLE